MPVPRVNVLPDGERWKVRFNFYSKFYPTRQEAIRSAIDMAHAAAQLQQDAEVLVQEVDGPATVIWVASRDSYPPPEGWPAD